MLPEVFPLLLLDLSNGRGGGVSGRVFGAREPAFVSSVHLWTGDTGVALVQRTPATFMSDWLFLLISVRSTR